VRVLIISLMMILSTAYLSLAVEGQDYSEALKSYQMKNYTKAIETLDQVISKNPTPSAYYLKGYALYKLQRNNEAQWNFKEAFFLDPEFNVDQFLKKVYEKDKSIKNKLRKNK